MGAWALSRPKLTGDRNQCPSCGEVFNSSAAFDRHRVPSQPGKPYPRRCLTADEMDAQGMVRNAAGFRVTQLMPWRPAFASRT